MRSLARKTTNTFSAAIGRGWGSHKLIGYALAALGPISVSAAHFLLSFSMLHLLAPGEFGRFAFFLVATQLGWGIWSALFCAPLPTFMTRGVREDWEAGRDMLLSANLFGAVLMLPIFAAMAIALNAPLAVVACYAVFGTLSLIRWFLRGYSYFENQQIRAVTSDVLYSCTVLAVAVLFLFVFAIRPELACFIGLLAGVLAGLTPFARILQSGARGISRLAFIKSYIQVWRDHSRWTVLGVVATEATANAHVYLITFTLGPAAFAPIAAAALLLRPLGVVQLALADFERPRLARLVSSENLREIRRSLTQFQLALGLVWASTAIAAILLFHYNGTGLVFPAEYDIRTMLIATSLWLLVAAARSLQVPPATILGVVGEFQRLAFASVCSSLISVVSVGVVLLTLSPVWSIGGLFVGALVYTVLTIGVYRSWRARFAERDGADLKTKESGDRA